MRNTRTSSPDRVRLKQGTCDLSFNSRSRHAHLPLSGWTMALALLHKLLSSRQDPSSCLCPLTQPLQRMRQSPSKDSLANTWGDSHALDAVFSPFVSPGRQSWGVRAKTSSQG
eukprot:270770-Hanusia_phi.AAC.5